MCVFVGYAWCVVGDVLYLIRFVMMLDLECIQIVTWLFFS
ncbi:protein of unknown function [Vibrio tapetis subsp. tapetis]|uniref:Uncharacterized protein n=1 Tax=Vibrio tapetis subsp. tapetis TaxID=1671868 RepID=A0A2N8ZHT7_9VIBR|nr:protein of unknown function [Vibrio tapetis subsp. tapetis]